MTHFAALPSDELREVLGSKDFANLVIAALTISDDDKLVLFWGDFRSLVVPLSTFFQVKGEPNPDAARVSVTDYGQTVRLGEYEIAVDTFV